MNEHSDDDRDPGSPSSSSDRCWIYLDDAGIEQGPYTETAIIDWFKQEFMTSDLLIRPCENDNNDTDNSSAGTESQWRPLSSIIPAQLLNEMNERSASDHSNNNNNENESKSLSPVQIKTESHSIDEVDIDAVANQSSTVEGGEFDSEPESESDSALIIPNDESHTTNAAAVTAVAPQLSIESLSNQWFYIDESGVIQGPHPTQSMVQWFNSGYFPLSTKVRTAAESEFQSIENHPNQPFAKIAKSHQPMGPKANPMIQNHISSVSGWYYLDRAGSMRGPYTNRQMRYWHSQGYFIFNQTQIKHSKTETQFKSLLDRSESELPEFIYPQSDDTSVILNNLLLFESTEQWFYIDQSNQTQGPFTTQQMREWIQAKLLPNNLLVKRLAPQHIGSAESQFKSINSGFYSFKIPLPVIQQNPNQQNQFPPQPQSTGMHYQIQPQAGPVHNYNQYYYPQQQQQQHQLQYHQQQYSTQPPIQFSQQNSIHPLSQSKRQRNQ